MNQFVLPFQKLSKKSVSLAGGKGANLGELTGKRIPVPPGFVVLRHAFDQFIRETDVDVVIDNWLHKLNPKDVTSLDRASHEIRDTIRRAPFPRDLEQPVLAAYRQLGAARVAVRSSATAEDSSIASWAGELESYMFVSRAKLLDTIKQCWSSLFTPRAIFYRFEKKLHRTTVSVAVVIQKMIDSDVSGVMFTAHPVTKDREQMVIEAGWGQGEVIVSGSITPDTYIFDRATESILDINVSSQSQMTTRQGASGTRTAAVPVGKRDKQKLTGKQIIEVATMGKKIEKIYGHPQDIEWAIEKNKLYITQTRPITTL